MGTIGAGPFENDDAQDFLDDLGDAPADRRPDLVLGALDRVLLATGHVAAPDMSEAVAAAAAVAASMSPGIATGEPELPEWLDEHPLDLDEELIEKSRQTLRGALLSDDNEWWELWEEAGQVDEVRIALKRSLDRLGDRDD